MTYLRQAWSAHSQLQLVQIANTLDDTTKLASGAENWQWLNSTLVA